MQLKFWKSSATPPRVQEVDEDNPLPVTGSQQGGDAAGADPTDNPVMAGVVLSDPANPPADGVAGKVGRLLADLAGRLIIRLGDRLDPVNDTMSIGASASSAGSLDTFRSLAVGAAAVAVKAASGRVHFISVTDRSAADLYVHFYDLAAAGVTPTATVPKQSYCVKANSTRDFYIVAGLGFATAISVMTSTQPNPDAGVATAPGTLPVLNIGYK
jgi:hypothetical protein